MKIAIRGLQISLITLGLASACRESGRTLGGAGVGMPDAQRDSGVDESASSSTAGASGAGNGGTATWPDCRPPTWPAHCENGWCAIPAGCFVMGSPEDEWGRALLEEQQVPVTLTRSFEIQQHEVTQEEWTTLGYANPSGVVSDGRGDCDAPDCPVGNVTWFEAIAYANLLSEQHEPPFEPCYVLSECTGAPGGEFECARAEATQRTVYECEGYRLPTDAEWEYSARAGTTDAFYSGPIMTQDEERTCNADENLEEIAWYCHNSEGFTHPVMQLTANPWGLFDVLGNASEWVNDEDDGSPALSETDPDGRVRASRPTRNRRGCRFNNYPSYCRVADQSANTWNFRQPGIGFRLARTLPQ